MDKWEYMTCLFQSSGSAETSLPDLEAFLDSKSCMGWKLHTIKFVDPDNTLLEAIVVFERRLFD